MHMMANIRKACACPFHVLDCHIMNHSPPTSMNATSHISSERVKAITAMRFSVLNTFAGLEEKFSMTRNLRQRISVRDARHPVPDPSSNNGFQSSRAVQVACQIVGGAVTPHANRRRAGGICVDAVLRYVPPTRQR